MEVTNFTAVDNVSDLLGIANVQTGGWFWTAMNIMFILVILITLSATTGSWIAGALTALFIGMLVQLFLVYLGLGSMMVMGIIIGGILGLIIYLIWSKQYD